MQIVNKNLRREYELIDKIEAGISLLGCEVKSLREGRAHLNHAYAKFVGNRLVLVSADISPYKFANNANYDPRRSRDLLLKRSEIIKIKTKIAGNRNLTLVPARIYTKGSLFKLEIALVSGKKLWERKRVEQSADLKRQTQKELKEYLKK